MKYLPHTFCRILGRILDSRVFVLWIFISCLIGCVKPSDKQDQAKSSASVLPVIKKAPTVHGVNADGKVFDSGSLSGSIWIASFMFSSCQGVCPVMNSQLSELQNTLTVPDVKFVSMTVDPENDTPEVLEEYGKRYKAQWNRWFFVRMSIDSVRALSVKGFLLTDPVEPSAHSPRYVLVDRNSDIRGYYDCMDSAKVVQLRADVATLLQEKVH